MILKQYSRLRHSFPIYFYATSKKLAKPQVNEPARTFREVDKRLSDYLFFKYDVNKQIEEELIELRKSASQLIKKTQPEVISRMDKILLGIPIETITESNMKIFKDLISIIKAQAISQDTNNIYNEVEKKISALDNSNENFNSLFRVYRISLDDQKMSRDQRAQIILKHLREDAQVKLTVEQISFFFQKISENYMLTPLEQQIRLNLLKRVKHTIPEISIKLLSTLATHLNAISHQDFIPEQLEIVKETFNKMTERESEMTEGIIQQVCNSKQYLSNAINLSQFYLKIFKTKHQGIKRHNSAQAHKLFQIVGMINSKILPAFGQNWSQLQLYKQFIVRYAQVNSKTDKHFQATIDIFVVLLNSGVIKHLKLYGQDLNRCSKMLQECKASPNARLFYLLAKDNIIIRYILTNFKDLWEKSAQSQRVILALAAKMMMFKQADHPWQKFLDKYFVDAQSFTKLIRMLQETSLPCIVQSFHACFQAQVSKLMKQSNVKQLEQQAQKQLLRSFMNYHLFQQKPLSKQSSVNTFVSTYKQSPILEYLAGFPIHIIQDNIYARLKDLSYRQIERQMEVTEFIIFTYGSQIKEELVIDLLERFNDRFRENKLSFDRILVYKRLMQFMTSQNHFFLSKQSSVRSLYSRLIKNFIKRHNNKCNDYHLSGFYVKIIANLIQKITLFDWDLTTKHLIIKEGLYCSLIANKNVNKIGVMNESCFTFAQIQKIRYFRYSKHETAIHHITHQTLPYLILNRNLHHYLESHKEQVFDLISSAKPSQFQNILRQFSYYSQPFSSIIFDIFLKIMKFLPIKIQISTIQRHVFFNNFCLKYYFRSQQLEKVVLLWIKYFTQKSQTIEDFQTHILILKLMKSLRMKYKDIERYLYFLFARYSDYPQKQEKIFYHILFLNVNFTVTLSSQYYPMTRRTVYHSQLSRYLTFNNPDIVLTSLLFLPSEFGYQCLVLLQKVIYFARDQLAHHGKVDFLSYYQYVYLKKTYPEETQNFNIPEESLNKTPFSVETPQAIYLLKSIADFLKEPLTKVQLHDNSIYKLRNNYIIFLPVDKQSCIHEFQYLRRLINCLLSNQQTSVTIIQRIEYSSYIPLSKAFKLDPLMNKQEWSRYYQKIRGEQKDQSNGRLNEDKGNAEKIARHKASYAQQLKQRMKNKFKRI